MQLLREIVKNTIFSLKICYEDQFGNELSQGNLVFRFWVNIHHRRDVAKGFTEWI